MDIDDITASLGAGSLRDSLRPRATRQTVGTFSTPRPLNLDEHWEHAQIRAALRPGYREDGAPRPGSRADHRGAVRVAMAPHEEVATMVRAAVRP